MIDRSKQVKFLKRSIKRNQIRRQNAVREAVDRGRRIYRDMQILRTIRNEGKK